MTDILTLTQYVECRSIGIQIAEEGRRGVWIEKNMSLKSFKDISEYSIESMRLQVGAYLGQT